MLTFTEHTRQALVVKCNEMLLAGVKIFLCIDPNLRVRFFYQLMGIVRLVYYVVFCQIIFLKYSESFDKYQAVFIQGHRKR